MPSSEITSYWDERSVTYSNGVKDELADHRRAAWETVLDAIVPFDAARSAGDKRPRVVDLGCGPGFFSVIYASAGWQVDAVDASGAMLQRASHNLALHPHEGPVEFHCNDVSKLPFAHDTFDLAISRNVTWLMSDPVATYAEWLRVLAPGGKLAVFDANWYRYLVDPELDLLRKQDQMHEVPEKSDARATPEEELRCERIAAKLPLTSKLRPAWDLEVLSDLGARRIAAHEDVWQHLWTPEECRYYRTSPLFLIVAEKG